MIKQLFLVILFSIALSTVKVGAQNGFVTTWQTTIANESITIPINSMYTYNYTINWGDGIFNTAVTGDATHTYQSAGSHTVEIVGDFPAIYFNNAGDKNKITAINQWGNIVWKSMSNAFNGCSNLQGLAIDNPDLSQVNDMSKMFNNATSFDQNIGNWNVSNVIFMNLMFNGVTLLTANYDALLIGWSTQILQSNVVVSGGNSNYCNGENARAILMNNPNSWTITDGGKDCSTLSLYDESIALEIKAYPNPTSGAFTIQLGEVNKNITIRITNALGQIIKETNYSNQETINLNIDSAKGLYFLHIKNDEGLSKYLNILKK